MNESTNPYAPPQVVDAMLVAPQAAQFPGVWRWGNVLVMAKEAQLPPMCVKNGVPANQWLKRNLQWHHPAISALILFGLLPYVIIAMILTKRASIQVGLCEQCYARRRKGIATAWMLALGSIGLFIGSIVLLATRNWETVGGWTMLASVLLFIGSLIYGFISARLVSPQRITDRFVWLNGVNREILLQLPDWPGYE